MIGVYFLNQIQHNKSTGNWSKGIVVKADGATPADNLNSALQGYHAYLGAYAYGNNADIDYVSVSVTDLSGGTHIRETWSAPADVEAPQDELDE